MVGIEGVIPTGQEAASGKLPFLILALISNLSSVIPSRKFLRVRDPSDYEFATFALLPASPTGLSLRQGVQGGLRQTIKPLLYNVLQSRRNAFARRNFLTQLRNPLARDSHYMI